MINIEMISDMVLIRIKKEMKSQGGIHLPADHYEYKISSDGEAVVVGPDCAHVKAGDLVYYKNGIGNHIMDDQLPKDSHFIVVSEKDILGIKKLKLAD